MLGLVTEDDDDGSEASGISAKTTTKKMANAPTPPAPAGWDSDEQSLAAHNALRDRIIALPEESAETWLKFRQEHGWPLTSDLFADLEEVVRVAEGFGAAAPSDGGERVG